jgi:hypothetical protein
VSNGNVPTSASWGWLVEGYRRALARFTASADRRDEPRERFIPLFETLHWAVAIMNYSGDESPELDDDLLRGLRFARNRVHHQLAEAIEPRDVPFASVVTNRRGGSRIIAPPTVLAWFWKPPDQLPAGRKDRKGEEAYRLHLADKRVEEALAHLDSLLDT